MDVEHNSHSDKCQYDYLRYDLVGTSSSFNININSNGKLETLVINSISIYHSGTSSPATSSLGFIRLICNGFGESFDAMGRKSGLVATIPLRYQVGSTYVYQLLPAEIDSIIELPDQLQYIDFVLVDENNTPLSGTFKYNVILHVNHIAYK
jgi:hypothetical protein